MRRFMLFAVVVLMATVPSLMALPISGSAVFSGGDGGNFTITYATGAADLYLQSFRIDLDNLRFDTQGGGSFSDGGSSSDFNYASGPFPYQLTPSSRAGRDGATSLEVLFPNSNFGPGNTFSFSIDVDRIGSCGFFQWGCLEEVSGNQFADSTITLFFGGENWETLEVSGTFSRLGNYSAQALFSGEAISTVSSVPEPATFLFIGSGLGALCLIGRRRIRKNTK